MTHAGSLLPQQAPVARHPCGPRHSRLVRLFTCQRAFGWPFRRHPYPDVSVRGRRILPPVSFVSIRCHESFITLAKTGW